MELIELKERPELSAEPKHQAVYSQFGALIAQMKKKELKPELLSAFNAQIAEVNTSSLSGKELVRLVKTTQRSILKKLEKDMKIVPKNYYRTLWMVVGMSAFGLPLGVAFGSLAGNMGLLGAGLPIGMAIGLALGSNMDKKAAQEGRQMDIEIKG
jgi:hypothetical protein